MRLYLSGTDKNSMYRGQSIPRRFKWWVERRIYGFDETETWSLDYTMIQLLYERVRRYKRVASKAIHMNQTVAVRQVMHTQEEWIDILLILMKQYLDDDFDNDKDGYHIEHYTKQMIWDIWSALHPLMWW